ncbi:class I SAM-dependent methyltransferase, partial [bacterium]|nr:class I SAM-dependent methyltransferase [bacterium]
MKNLSIIAALLFCAGAPPAAGGMRGGLVVVLGCGEPARLTMLHAQGNTLVQGLDVSAKRVDAAREYIRAQGVYGPVSAEVWDGKTLPYAENLVNLIIDTRADGKVSQAEVARVLAPRGVAMAHRGGAMTTTFTKPVPKNID